VFSSTALVEGLRSALSQRPEVLDAYLFGSHARDEARANSDVDVAVFVDARRARDDGYGFEASLASELMRALATDRVDVVVLNRAPPLLYHRVLRDGLRVLARDLAATTVREGRALSRYCDYVPQLEKFERAASARTRAGGFGR
jgi:predicted nucleotidyltransferase